MERRLFRNGGCGGAESGSAGNLFDVRTQRRGRRFDRVATQPLAASATWRHALGSGWCQGVGYDFWGVFMPDHK
jgi:hypothetical protein